jgi:hypothetical protein
MEGRGLHLKASSLQAGEAGRGCCMTDFTHIGTTDFRGNRRWFGYTQADRRLPTWIIGKTGMGKTTLLKTLIAQDLHAGRGLCLFDLHGDLARQTLDLVPTWRTGHVAYFSPVDETPIGLNVLEHVPADRRHTVASAVVSIFKDVWGESGGIQGRSEDLLRNAVTALLDIPESTLLWLPRFITDHPWRERLLPQVTDPVVRAYWQKEFARYMPKMRVEYTAAILNKIRAYLTAPPLRHVFGQWNSRLDVRWLMDHRRILIVDLAKGRLGEDKATLVGKMVMMKLVLAAFSRVDTPEEQRTDFAIIADEMQTVCSPVMTQGLSELRKFHTPLTLAHQYCGQVPTEVLEALRGNVGTLICFQIGAQDAETLEAEFAPEFTRRDLINLKRGQAYVRLACDGQTTRPFSALTQPYPAPAPDEQRREAILQASRQRFGRPREVVERWIEQWYAEQEKAPPAPTRRVTTRQARPGARTPLPDPLVEVESQG